MISRVIKNGFINFGRSGGSSWGAIFVIIITLSIVTSLFLAQGVVKFVSSNLQEKLGITVYFQPQASSTDISQFKDLVSKFPSVKKATFISKEKALKDFRDRHKDDPLTIKALDVLGENPFYDSLNIQAQNASQYQSLNKFLSQESFQNIIYKIDYTEKENIINRLSSFTSNLNKTAIILSLIFVLIAILITFNTIKLSISSSKQEIQVTRLIGGSSWFTQGPFIIQGLICGFLAALITFSLFFALSYFLGPKLKLVLMGFDMLAYIMDNFSAILLINFVGGIGVGILASWLAVRKYMRI